MFRIPTVTKPLVATSLALLATSLQGQINLTARVLTTTATTSVISFTAEGSGTLSAERFPGELWNHLIIDCSSSPGIAAATTGDYGSVQEFSVNTLEADTGNYLRWIEFHENDGRFDRLNIVFYNALSETTSLADGTTATFEMSTTTAMQLDDFDGLPIYWGTDNSYTDPGVLVGSMSIAVIPEAANSCTLLALSVMALFLQRRKR